MAAPSISNFSDFWPYYLKAHRSPLNRALHYAGTSAALVALGAALVGAKPLLLVAVPLIGYGPAWLGHFLVEGNRPATLDYARYSLLGDLKMLTLALSGRLSSELARVDDEAVAAE